jgi:hypothetical protein
VARAVLDASTRRALRALFDGRLERAGAHPFLGVRVPRGRGPPRGRAPVRPGARPTPRRRYEPDEDPGAYVYLGGQEHPAEVPAEVMSLAGRLATPGDIARRLADNPKTEPVASVRLQCLATLAREFADHPATAEALLAARVSPEGE